MQLSTREKILLASLEEFSDQGVAQVSTNHIADSLDISPGNLYHHFKSKPAILEELYQWFVRDFVGFLRADEHQVTETNQLWMLLNLCFQLMHRYRFVFRDSSFVIQKYPQLEKAFREVVNKTDSASRKFCQRLDESGVINLEPPERECLATNLHLLFTQWANYGVLRSPLDKSASSDDPYQLKLGFYQILALFMPYVSEPNKAAFVDLYDSYDVAAR